MSLKRVEENLSTENLVKTDKYSAEKKKIASLDELNALIENAEIVKDGFKKKIADLDLSDIDLDNVNFRHCEITNVDFARENQKDRSIRNAKFNGAKLDHVSFCKAHLIECDFDKYFEKDAEGQIISEKSTNLEFVTFKGAKLKSCRFRQTEIDCADFRYATNIDCTFQNAIIKQSDFYRAIFKGIVVFRDSKFENCSFNYMYFEGTCFRKENLLDHKIIQEDIEKFRKFLNQWNRTNLLGNISNWDKEEFLRKSSDEAANIYRQFSGLWQSKGFLTDANWAYEKARKMERKNLIRILKEKKSGKKSITTLVDIFSNWLVDVCFGYGQKLYKIIFTYILVIVFFGFIYSSFNKNYSYSFLVSFKNMVAMAGDDIKIIGHNSLEMQLLEIFSIIQTAVGVLITGIFGFILANKIRNS